MINAYTEHERYLAVPRAARLSRNGGDLYLGDLPVNAMVFHPYWRMGWVWGKVENGVYVQFMPEFDNKSKLLVREAVLRLLPYNERIAVWQA
jgi:hypothetical protein